MEQKTPQAIQEALAKPFAPEDLEWRLQTVFENGTGIAVPYVTNRAIQTRLDSVVGVDHWSNEYQPWHSTGKKEAQICGISIYFEDRGWITKWDGAEDSDIEPVKGGLSDSMKRAAVQWGIGRCLYGMDVVYVNVTKRGKTMVIQKEERSKLDQIYCKYLEKLSLTPVSAGGVQAQLTEKTAQNTTLPTVPQAKSSKVEYTVKNAAVRRSKSGVSTSLTLVDSAGKATLGFVRGEHPEIKAGVQLCNVKQQLKQRDSVVFYLLDSFEIADTERAA